MDSLLPCGYGDKVWSETYAWQGKKLYCYDTLNDTWFFIKKSHLSWVKYSLPVKFYVRANVPKPINPEDN